MADESTTQSSAAAPAANDTPSSGGLAERLTTATAGSPEPSSAAAIPSTPDGAAAPAQSSAPPSGTEWQGVRDYAKAQGVDLPFEDDSAALQALIRSHQEGQQRNYYTDLGRQVAPQAQAIAEYLRQRQAQQAQPQAPPPWQGPEFQKDWLQLVERDENTGRLRSKAGYDPAIAEKVEAYAQWREKFLDQPEQVIAPLIEQRAQQLIEAKFTEYNERQTADQIVAANAGWMFAADAQGRPVYTPQGQRQLTAEGVGYARAADTLWRGGLRDVRQIDALARAQVENVILRQRLLATAPAASNGATTLAATTDLGGGLTRPSAAKPVENGSQKGMSLAQRLMVNLDRAGAPENLTLH